MKGGWTYNNIDLFLEGVNHRELITEGVGDADPHELMTAILVALGIKYTNSLINKSKEELILELNKMYDFVTSNPNIIINPAEKDIERLKDNNGIDNNLIDLAGAISAAQGTFNWLDGKSVAKVYLTGKSWHEDIEKYRVPFKGWKDFNASDIVVRTKKDGFYGVSLKKKQSYSQADPTMINKSIGKAFEEIGSGDDVEPEYKEQIDNLLSELDTAKYNFYSLVLHTFINELKENYSEALRKSGSKDKDKYNRLFMSSVMKDWSTDIMKGDIFIASDGTKYKVNKVNDELYGLVPIDKSKKIITDIKYTNLLKTMQPEDDSFLRGYIQAYLAEFGDMSVGEIKKILINENTKLSKILEQTLNVVSTETINSLLKGDKSVLKVVKNIIDRDGDLIADLILRSTLKPDIRELLDKAISEENLQSFDFALITGSGRAVKKDDKPLVVDKYSIQPIANIVKLFADILDVPSTLDHKDKEKSDAATLRYTLKKGKLNLLNIEIRYKGNIRSQPTILATMIPSLKKMISKPDVDNSAKAGSGKEEAKLKKDVLGESVEYKENFGNLSNFLEIMESEVYEDLPIEK